MINIDEILKDIEKQLSQVEYNPSIKKDVEEFLTQKVFSFKPKHILEIGTNLGRSSLLFFKASPFSLITTIEKDEQTFLKAKENFFRAGVSENIIQMLGDAKQVIETLQENSFDFIFLDGPKGQYINYLPTLKKLLKVGGILVADNVLFKGQVLKDELPKKKHRTIIVNLKKFLNEIKSDKNFKTEVLTLGDGLSVSYKLS